MGTWPTRRPTARRGTASPARTGRPTTTAWQDCGTWTASSDATGEWRIAARQIVLDWTRDDPVVGGSGGQSPGTQYGRRDRSDPAYTFGR